MPDADTIERARRVVAGLVDVEGRATLAPWRGRREGDDRFDPYIWAPETGSVSGDDFVISSEGDHDKADADVIVALRNAAAPLLELAELAAWRRGVELARAAMAAEPLDYEGDELADQRARCNAIALEEADLDARWGPAIDAALAGLAGLDGAP